MDRPATSPEPWEKAIHKGQWRLWSQLPVQNRWGFPGPGIQVDRKEQKSGIWVGFCPCLLAAIRAFAGRMLLRRSLNCITKTLQLCAELGHLAQQRFVRKSQAYLAKHLFTDYCYHVALFRCKDDKDARDCESVKPKKYGKFGNIKLRQLRQVQRHGFGIAARRTCFKIEKQKKW